MKLVLRDKRKKGFKNTGYNLLITMGVVFALSALTPFSIYLPMAAIAVVLTGSLL